MAKKETYRAAPTVPPELAERYRLVLVALAGGMSVAEAARQAGLVRNHFQTVMHRAQAALLEALADRPPGRPPKPDVQVELEAQVARLTRENERLKERLATFERLLGVAGGLLRGEWKTVRRKAKTSSPAAASAETTTPEAKDDEEPPQPLELVADLRASGVSLGLAALVAGVSAATVRRHARGLVGVRRSRATELDAHTQALVEDHVRSLPLIGADALGRVHRVSRRAAARLKRDTLAAVERERKARATRVRVEAAGLGAGFDALVLRAAEGNVLVLLCTDAALPYVRSLVVVRTYDADSVAAALAADFALHGPPFWVRLDRHASHRAPAAVEVLAGAGVLALHGPPRHPRYYGQHERQNRDLRALAQDLEGLPADVIERELRRRVAACNETWPRRSLGWQTPAELWSRRPRLETDEEVRRALIEEVQERAARLRHDASAAGRGVDQSERFALEVALERRGWLRRRERGWC